tara:strand:+ start:5243 stop:6205 length:963 start_codon:yes stop_codon:yes gene_type:complete
MEWNHQLFNFKKISLVLMCMNTGCTDPSSDTTENLSKSPQSIKNKLYAQLESRTLEHPAMLSLVDTIQTQYSDNINLKAKNSLQQWLCLNDKYVSEDKNLQIEETQNSISEILGNEQNLRDWIHEKCPKIRKQIEKNTELDYLHDTQKKLLNVIDESEKEKWINEFADTSLICAKYFYSSPSSSDDVTIQTITSVLPGFSNISSLRINLDENDDIPEPLDLDLNTDKDLSYSFHGNHSDWSIQGITANGTPVSCQLHFDICEERRLEVEKQRYITYGEYLALKTNNLVPETLIGKPCSITWNSCRAYQIHVEKFENSIRP